MNIEPVCPAEGRQPSHAEEVSARQRRPRDTHQEAEQPEQPSEPVARVNPASRPAPKTSQLVPPPTYLSWEDFLARTTPLARVSWCREKARKANRPRLMSGPPENQISAEDVWTILEAARGRCAYCGSLAVESRPSRPNGAPAPWDAVGRRVGSLSHRTSRFAGGANTVSNLVWSCLWCNTWSSGHVQGATDHGGYSPTVSRPI